MPYRSLATGRKSSLSLAASSIRFSFFSRWSTSAARLRSSSEGVGVTLADFSDALMLGEDSFLLSDGLWGLLLPSLESSSDFSGSTDFTS